MTNVGEVLAMVRACVNNTMAFRARTNPNACPIFALMVSVAETYARAGATRARKRARAQVTMACADRFFPAEIPITNARPANVMVQALAIRPKYHSPMARLVSRARNVRQVIASMDSVATRRAPEPAKLAPRRKKAAEPMARVATLLRQPIPMANVVMADNAEETEPAATTMALPAPPQRNAFPIIALMASVVATSATRRVMHVPRRKRGKASTELAGPLPLREIPITNARPANAMVRGRAANRKYPKPMARPVHSLHNAFQVSVSKAFVAIRRAPELAKLARPRKKAKVRAARVDPSNTTRIPTRNVMAGRVRERARANTTIACHAQPGRNVCLHSVSTAFAAAINAAVRVMHVQRPKKERAKTASVA